MTEQRQEIFKGTAEEIQALKDYLETIKQARQIDNGSKIKAKGCFVILDDDVSIETNFHGKKKSSKIK